MKNCTLSINVQHFAAALHLAAKGDVRYYLNGVNVEAWEGETRCIATNGHALGVCRDMKAVNGMGGEPAISLIVPRDIAELIVKTTRGKGHIALWRTDGKWVAKMGQSDIGFTPVDGRFPEYRQIIPQESSGEAAQYNAELMMLFNKAAKSLGRKALPEVTHNGTSGALVTLDGFDDFLGVVMPFKTKERKGCDVSWGRSYPPAPLAAAA